jgi:hypothetical protein
VKLLFYPTLLDLRNSTFLKGSQDSPVCLSGKSNMYMKTSMEHWWNDIERGKLKYREKNLPL